MEALDARQLLFRALHRAEHEAWQAVGSQTFEDPQLTKLLGESAERTYAEIHRHEAWLDMLGQLTRRLAAQARLTERELHEVALDGVLGGWTVENL